MIIDALSIEENDHFTGNVCIVGGGVAGIVIALELEKRGVSGIIVLESGDEEYGQDTQNLYSADQYPSNFADPLYSRLRFLGGSSNHWANNTSPFDPIDFEKREWVPNSGWPISYSDIQTYFSSAEMYCGVDRDSYATDYWARHLNARDLSTGNTRLNTSMAKAAIPPVRFYMQFKDKVLASRKIILVKNINLKDLNFDKEAKVVSSIVASTLSNRISVTVTAKKYVFSMGGIENARMLLFFNQKHSNQLGNLYDNVGRYFMDHPIPRAAILFPEKGNNFDLYDKRYDFETKKVSGFFSLSEQTLKEHNLINLRMSLREQSRISLSRGIKSLDYIHDEISDAEIPDDFGYHIGEIVSDLDMVNEKIMNKYFGTSLSEDAKEMSGFILRVMMQQLPDRNNQISLSEKKDKFGIPKINIDWKVTAEDRANLWNSLETAALGFGQTSIGRLMLLQKYEDLLFGDNLSLGHHHMGTTRMSSSEKTGVVDKNQKVYGSKNLYVAGSSVFTTSSHVPPTFTIVALSIRLSAILSKELNDG